MDLERKRVATKQSKTGVVTGSVWESRMRGSFKVFNCDNDNNNQDIEKPIGKRKKWKNDGNNNSDGNDKSPVQISGGRSENKKKMGELSKELSDGSDGIGIKKRLIQMKNKRPEWNKTQTQSVSVDQRTIKTRSLSRIDNGIQESEKVKPNLVKEIETSDECDNGIEESEGGCKDDNVVKKDGSDCDQNSDELDVGDEKLMEVDLKEVKCLDNEQNVEVNEERAIVVVNEIEPVSTTDKKKSPDVVVIEDKKISHRNERSNVVSRTMRKELPPVVNHPRTISKPSKLPSQKVPKSHSKLQSLFDLIMWKDASKSALIFGFGTFAILSSSYTQDLNISFIAVISYLSLIYLAVTFIFKSFIFRGFVEADNITNDEEYVVGEEEAIWALKIFLPYINEFLLKVKALFSGDPATTMKMAVLLLILAKCGSSITIWKMAKLAFFGVFTVPKIFSSYSSQLSAYGAFWIRRFKDAWDSCSQKKAVAFGIFTLVWNLSSIVARIWAVFMLLVAFKYYQQSMAKEDEVVEEEEPIAHRTQSSWQEQRNGKHVASNGSSNLRKRS